MFFHPDKLTARFYVLLLLVFCIAAASIEANAQSKKNPPKPAVKAAVAKKPSTTKTNAKVDPKKNGQKNTSKKENAKDNATAKNASKKDKSTDKTSKANKNAKPTKAELARLAEAKRRDDIARKAQEARLRAALEEKRRREQAIREAQARAAAFERGLRLETQANIASDNLDGEDLEVRDAAVKALGTHAGTVVVMEPQTGKVLSIVNQDWAVRKGFKPCSTVKLVTATAGLSENVIDSTGAIQTQRFPMSLDDALAHSNNSYFQTVGASVGSEKLISYAKALGLGEQTGINVQNESPGRLPYGNNNARIYSHGDDFEVTAVQLAVAVSAISNGGKIVVPQIPKTKFEAANFHGYLRKDVGLPQSTLQRILPGMLGAVNYGTARRASDGNLNIAGKTGSCIGQGSWLGLFASVAPVINPRLAVIVITRGSGERGKYASEIAGNIYKALSHRFNDGRDFTAKVPLELRPQQKVTAKNSATLDNEKGEDSDEGDVKTTPARKPGAKTDVTTSAPKPPTIFDPIVIQLNREQTRPRIVPMKSN